MNLTYVEAWQAFPKTFECPCSTVCLCVYICSISLVGFKPSISDGFNYLGPVHMVDFWMFLPGLDGCEWVYNRHILLLRSPFPCGVCALVKMHALLLKWTMMAVRSVGTPNTSVFENCFWFFAKNGNLFRTSQHGRALSLSKAEGMTSLRIEPRCSAMNMSDRQLEVVDTDASASARNLTYFKVPNCDVL